MSFGDNSPIAVAFQNLTIANTVAAGGAGGSGTDGGGGGGAGLGGAIFVGSLATVTVSNVSIVSSSAAGGDGGSAAGTPGGGGGGGLGGPGGSGTGGGGGVGLSAAGSNNGSPAGPGILTNGGFGGEGGAGGGGGGGSLGQGGGGGGDNGGFAVSGVGGSGGYGGGGGGGTTAAGVGGTGGVGGGGGGGTAAGGSSLFGGGGGGTTAGGAAPGGFGGGNGSTTGGGGGGAGFGGAIFVEAGGALTVAGAFTVNGSSVSGGHGAAGAADGIGQAGALFLGGFGQITFSPGAGESIVIADAIADEAGLGGDGANAWGLFKDGAGTLTLLGSNAYSGGTAVADGVLTVAADGGLGAGGSVRLFGTSTLAITGTAAFARDLFLLGTPTVSVAGGRTATWSGVVADDDVSAALTVSGGGTLALTNTANAYSGGTFVIGNSTLLVGGDGALGAAGTAVTLGDASSGGTLAFLTGTSTVSARDVTLAGGGTLDLQGTSLAVLSGAVSGPGHLTKAGTGTLLLSTPVTHTGGTSLDGGVLAAGAANILPVGTFLNVAAGATFDQNDFSQTLGNVSGAGRISLGSGTLVTGSANADATFGGAIDGTGALVKTGTGMFTLTGANTFSGGTTVAGGTLAGTTVGLQGAIVNNATVVFDQAFAGAYAGNMSGTGHVTKAGTGAVTLSGTNTYTGGTTVSGGTLTGTTTSLRGDLVNNAAVVFDQAFAGTYSGAMSGTGVLTATGGGILTLAGTNTYTGPAAILSGVLRAGSAAALPANSPIAVAAGATLDLNGFDYTLNALGGSGNVALGGATLTMGSDGSSTALAATISGSGSFVKSGAGTLTLLGANSYSGGTAVTGGVLAGTTSSIQGTIANDALVVFDQGFNGTYAGSMSGAGALQKAGAGTLTLSGHNTYTGGTFITGGSLVTSGSGLSGVVVNTASLVFGGAGDGAFTGLLTGSGAIDKTGPGTLTITGSHPFSGTTTISGGTLALDGTLAGSVTVGAGAAFDITGGIGGSLRVDGALTARSSSGAGAVARPPGTPLAQASSGDRLETGPVLVVGGSLFAGPGSTLRFPIGAGLTPSLLAGGTATLNGTAIDVSAQTFGNERHLSFIALTALGGLSVANTAVSTGDPLVVPALKQDATSLYITLLNLGVPLASSATTGNGAAAAGALDRMKHDLSGDRGFVLRELTALDDPELDNALVQIAGELHASSRHLAVRGSEAFTDMIRSQFMEREHEEATGVPPGAGGNRVRWWGQVSREHTTFRPRDGAFGGGMDLTDSAGGFDMRLSDRWLIGGGGGFGSGRLGLDGAGSSSDAATPRAFGVVGFQPKGFGIHGGASVSRSVSTSERALHIIATLAPELGGGPLTEGIDRVAAGDDVTVQSDEWSEYADHQNIRTFRLDYLIGVRHARFVRSAFTESGAGALSLLVPDETLNLNQADVKVHFWRRKGRIRPYVETLYRRSSDWPADTTVSLAEEQDSAFKTAGLPLGSDAFAGRVGAAFVRGIGTLTLEYRYRKAAGQTVQAGELRFRF